MHIVVFVIIYSDLTIKEYMLILHTRLTVYNRIDYVTPLFICSVCICIETHMSLQRKMYSKLYKKS